jgi:hypothetical protein
MSVITKTVQIGDIRVDLYQQIGCPVPHGFEATKTNTTNTSGYYRTGGLIFQGKELVDYDGVSELPAAVIAALEQIGLDASYAK